MKRTFALIALLASCAGGDGPTDTDTDTDTGPTWDCEPASRDGRAGSTDGVLSAGNIRYNVRTPDDYDDAVAHPLLMVYAPAGANAGQTEQFTGLTPDALARGWVVAYANHVSPRSVDDIQPLAEVVGEVAETWCIDTERVYLTGHSDGGSADHVIAGFTQLGYEPAGIAPSAAGINTATLSQFTCPASPVPAFIMHSRNDGLFPVSEGFGGGAAEWWASCNGCGATPSAPDASGCVRWTGCTDDAEVVYCENAGSHGTWPRVNGAMLDFLEGS